MGDALSIRPYRSEDLAAVVAIFQRAVRETASRYYAPQEIDAWAPEPPDTAFWRDRLARGKVWVCEADGAIAGFLRLEEDGYVDLVFVHPGFQRRGVASALLDHAAAWAAAHGIGWLFTEASRSARAFFEAKGFRVVRPRHGEKRGVALETFVMERPLEG